MSDVENWKRSAIGNSELPPNGFPERMDRDAVNDSSREQMAATKRWYDDPGFRNPFGSFTLTRTTGTFWILVDGSGETNAGQFLAPGQRVRMVITTNPGVDYWEGWIASIAGYAAPNQAFSVEWLPSPISKDLLGPPTATNVRMTVSIKELGKAAWYDVGGGAGQIPLVENIKDYAISTDEEDLDVGFLEGLTALELSAQSVRGRLNANGGFDFWSRGVSFTSATTPNNDNNNVFADNWTLMSDGNNRVEISRSTETPAGIPVRYSAKMVVSSGASSNQKHGIISFVEQQDAIDVGRGSTPRAVSFSFWIKQGSVSGIKSVRAYLLNLKNTAPSVQPISSWASGSEGIDPTFDPTDWENPAGLMIDIDLDAIGTTWTEFKLENVSLAGSGSGAVAMAFVVDDAAIVNPASWHLAAVQLNTGARALPFLPMPRALEAQRLARYYEDTFDEEAGVYAAAAAGITHALVGRTATTNPTVVIPWRFRAAKFKTPTIKTFNPRVAGTGFDDGTSLSVALSSAAANRQQANLISVNTATANTTYYIGAAAAANIWGNG